MKIPNVRNEPLNREKGDLFEYGVIHWIATATNIPQWSLRNSKFDDEIYGIKSELKHYYGFEEGEKIFERIFINHAQRSAYTILNHAIKMGHIPSGNTLMAVYHTSFPGEIKKLTGIPDPDNPADLVIVHRDTHWNKRHLGVSLKYVNNKPNYKNPGLETLSRLSKSELGKHWTFHLNDMVRLGYSGTIAQRHAQYKKDKTENPIRASNAEASALIAKSLECKVMWEGFKNQTSEELLDVVRWLVNPQTQFPVLHAVGLQDDKYQGDFWCKVQEANEKFNLGMRPFVSLHADYPPEGTVVRIFGRTTTGKDKTLVAINLRARSGPHQSLQATTTADFLENTKENIPYKAKVRRLREKMRMKHEQNDKQVVQTP